MRMKIAAVVLVLFAGTLALAATPDITGKWTASFETQIGKLDYTYNFKVEGEKLTGTAANQFGESKIEDGTVKADQVSFTETIDFQGQKITIKYTGKIEGDTIKFTRQVAEFATEELVAKRAK